MAFGGSNPPLATSPEVVQLQTGSGRAGVAQLAEHQPSKLRVAGSTPVSRSRLETGVKKGMMREYPSGCCRAHVAQSVERVLGKDEVSGSIPLVGSILVLVVEKAAE